MQRQRVAFEYRVLRMWRFRFAVGLCLGLSAVLALPSGSANAQGFFQSLFGWGSSKPGPQPRIHRKSSPRENSTLPWLQQDTQPKTKTQSSRYRTMCVRTCDGFYFPISGNSERKDFRRDAESCNNRCGASAKLYYLGRESDDIKGMRDLSGKSYAQLPAAFSYRKKLKSGCTCRPMPWSAAERARHAGYAAYDAYRKLQEKRTREALELARNGAIPERTTEEALIASAEQQPDPASSPASPENDAMLQDEADGTAENTHDGLPVLRDIRPIELAAIASPALTVPVTTVSTTSLYRAEPVRPRRVAKRKSRRAPAQKSNVSLTGWLPTGGASNYTWPGDAPRR